MFWPTEYSENDAMSVSNKESFKETGSLAFLSFGALNHRERSSGHIEVCWRVRDVCKDHLGYLFRWLRYLLLYFYNHKRNSKWESPTEPRHCNKFLSLATKFLTGFYAMKENLSKSCASFCYSFLGLHAQHLHYNVSSKMAGTGPGFL